MRRRDFTIFLGGAAAWPLAALARPGGKVPVIGYLVLANPEPVFGFFRDGLQKLGYVDGKSIRIELRTADGKPDRLAALAAELVRLKVDVLVAHQTPAVTAAKRVTSALPIVMAGAGDPVATGLIASLARPGGNITGTSGTGTEMGAKTLELIREVIPSAKRMAVLANQTDPFTKPFLDQLQRASGAMAIELLPYMIRESADFNAAFQDMVRRKVEAVIVQPSLQRRAAADSALKHRVPAVSSAVAFPGDGGLMAYAAEQADMQRNSAIYVDKILKGARPGDLPVQQPTKYELVVNLKTAKALGIRIPQSLLLRADKVIE